MQRSAEQCLTCYGTGETVVDGIPAACPDCFGEGKALSHGTKLEWRLRAIEQAYRQSERETAGDVLWLVNELRQARESLLRILARCQDADDSDTLASEVRTECNQALGLYMLTDVDNPR
jgi:hypothetical protein